MRKMLVIFALAVACMLFSAHATDQPVIGIFSIPSVLTDHPPDSYSYIPASYIKLMESAGARVVPIPYDASPENITFLLSQVNGVVFIGGGSDKTAKDPVTGKTGPSNVSKALQLAVKHVIAANQNGENVPLMATCMGYEILMMTISNQWSGLLYNKFNEANVKANVNLMPGVGNSSRIWSALTPELRTYSQSQAAYLYDHHNGLLPNTLTGNAALNDFFTITSVSKPVNGGPTFVASIEGRKYPIFGFQFHPEKSPFEQREFVAAPHTSATIRSCQLIAKAFVAEARKNNRSFKNDQVLQDSLIYNWAPLQIATGFTQVYALSLVSKNHTEWPVLTGTKRVAQTDPALKVPKRPAFTYNLSGGSVESLQEGEYRALRAQPIVQSVPYFY